LHCQGAHRGYLYDKQVTPFLQSVCKWLISGGERLGEAAVNGGRGAAL
jgi:hypothetical protein